MATLRVIHHIGDLADDLAKIPPTARRDMADTVRKNGDAGLRYAKGLARSLAGPHGKAYYKRLSMEMTGPLTAEYGPEGSPKTDFVGVGFRHGVNRDLPKSADIVAPKFARDVERLADRWFW